MPRRVSEGSLVIPAVEELYNAPGGELSTSDLIKRLMVRFSPEGEDAEILQNRSDTKFSQKVRNLKSHKTLLKGGWATEIEEGFRITEKGRSLIESLAD